MATGSVSRLSPRLCGWPPLSTSLSRSRLDGLLMGHTVPSHEFTASPIHVFACSNHLLLEGEATRMAR